MSDPGSSGDPRLRLELRGGIRAGDTFEIGADRLIVGSDRDCDIVLGGPGVSGEHASLKLREGHLVVHDLGSGTGTFVNGLKITTPTVVGPGDRLTIGGGELAVVRASEEPSEAAPPAAPASRHRRRIGFTTRGALIGTSILLIGAAAAIVALIVDGASRTRLTPEQLIARASPAVVRITGSDGAGSGVVIDAKRQLVLTNAHVVVGNGALEAQLGDDRSRTSPLQLVAASPGDDLAVVKLVTPLPRLKALPLGTSATVRPGDTVTVLGFPGSFQTTPGSGQIGQQQASTVVANIGSVSQVDVQATPDPSLPTYQSLIVHQAPTNHGNSGGPLLDERGQVVGINTLGNPSNQGQYYSIAIDYAKRLLPDLEAGRSHGLIGWNLVQLSAEDPHLTQTLEDIYASDSTYAPYASRLAADTAAFLQAKPATTGMYDLGDEPGSAADKANVGAGWLIYNINGTPVRTMSDVCDIVNSARPGQTLRIHEYNIAGGSDSSELSAQRAIDGRSYSWHVDLKVPSN